MHEDPPGRKGYVEIQSICPMADCPVVVEGMPTPDGFAIRECSRWKDGFTCSTPCSAQVGLEYSVHLARQVQEMLEPPEQVDLSPLSAASLLLVSQSVGGDFQVVKSRGRRLLALQGDVVGKGLNAGLLAAYLVGLFEGIASRAESGSGRWLGELNRQLVERTSSKPMFATALLVEADLDEPYWKISRAGHELPLLLRADGSCFDFKNGACLPLGVEEGEFYPQLLVPRLAGDRLFVSSDGALEAGLTPELVVSLLGQPDLAGKRFFAALLSKLAPPPYRDDLSLLLLESSL